MIEYFEPRNVPPPTRQRSVIAWLLLEAGWFILCAGGGALCVVAVGFMFGVSLGFWSVLFALLATVALAIRARIVRRSRAMLTVNYLEQAVRLNLPIPPMLAAAQAAESAPMRRRLARLGAEISAGTPIAISLRRASPGAPPRVIGLIMAGERLGRLPQALRRSSQTERRFIRDHRRALQSIMLRWYPMLIPIVLLPVFFLIMIFVMPKYKQIFKDFGLELPGVTMRLLYAWDYLAIPLVIVAGLAVAATCARLFSDLFPLQRASLRRLGIWDRFTWSVPPWRKIVRSRALADACHVIADALSAAQPADRAILDAAEISPNVVFRSMMMEWARYVSEGIPLAQAATKAGLPSLVPGMLATARDSAGTAEVFSFLARYYDGRYSKAAAFVEGAAIPVMVLITAAFVLTLALGIFLPIQRLIERLSTMRWVM